MDPEHKPKSSGQAEQGDLVCLTTYVGKIENLAGMLLGILGCEDEEPLLGLRWRRLPALCSRPIVIGEMDGESGAERHEYLLPDILVQFGEGVGQLEILVGGLDPRQQIFQKQHQAGRVCIFDSSEDIAPAGNELYMLLRCLKEIETALDLHLEDLKSWHPDAKGLS
jgi:hypothetical protein